MLKRFRNKSLLCLVFLSLVLLLSVLPFLDYHQLLLPHPDVAAMKCLLTNISKEEVVTYVGNYGDQSLKHFIQGVNIRKEFQCHFILESLHSEIGHTFLYQNIYTGISMKEIDKMIQDTREKYQIKRNRWRYNNNLFTLPTTIKLDRWGFSDTPFSENTTHYWTLFWVHKIIILSISSLLTFFLYLCLLRQQHRDEHMIL